MKTTVHKLPSTKKQPATVKDEMVNIVEDLAAVDVQYMYEQSGKR